MACGPHRGLQQCDRPGLSAAVVPSRLWPVARTVACSRYSTGRMTVPSRSSRPIMSWSISVTYSHAPHSHQPPAISHAPHSHQPSAISHVMVIRSNRTTARPGRAGPRGQVMVSTTRLQAPGSRLRQGGLCHNPFRRAGEPFRAKTRHTVHIGRKEPGRLLADCIICMGIMMAGIVYAIRLWHCCAAIDRALVRRTCRRRVSVITSSANSSFHSGFSVLFFT